MAAPFPTSYYLAIGTAISNLGVLTELSGGSYARLACGFTGTALSGLTQTVGPWVVATAPTPAVNSYYGAIFDALTGGNLIAYWTWSPGANGAYTGSLTAFPSTVINIVFNTYVQTALNMALVGGQGSSGSLLDSGSQIGTVNGNPMLTGSRLGIAAGGSLVAHTGQGQWVGSMDVQNTLSFNALQSGNINSVTALAGGGSTGSVPVLTGFSNRLATVATSLDSCILPAPAASPAGSLLLVVNSGAATAQIFADVGSSINVAGTTTLNVVAGASCFLSRVTPSLWVSVPKVPS